MDGGEACVSCERLRNGQLARRDEQKSCRGMLDKSYQWKIFCRHRYSSRVLHIPSQKQPQLKQCSE